MKIHVHPRLLSLAICVLAIVLLASWAQSPARTSAVSTGLTNPGFESGVLGGLSDGWATSQPIPDAVKVVGAEGPRGTSRRTRRWAMSRSRRIAATRCFASDPEGRRREPELRRKHGVADVHRH